MKIGIIGYGNMGSAIAQQLKNNYDILVFDKDTAKINGLQGIVSVGNIAELADKAGIIVLAVKPQDFADILSEIGGSGKNKLFISIAAGISTSRIEEKLGPVRVIRVMPNLPAKIGEGMSCLAQGKFASLDDLDLAENLFDYLGETLVIEESMMDQATAVSGSGPAYVCNFLESGNLDPKNIPAEKKNAFLRDFQKAAQDAGFTAEDAKFLVNTTFNGTISFLRRENLSPAGLRKQVTSKAGTTEAALEVLDRGGRLSEAVKRAAERAKELSRG
jgi:pyrroline-5-carboxylate reductase